MPESRYILFFVRKNPFPGRCLANLPKSFEKIVYYDKYEKGSRKTVAKILIFFII